MLKAKILLIEMNQLTDNNKDSGNTSEEKEI
jgi:hypothetical protein